MLVYLAIASLLGYSLRELAGRSFRWVATRSVRPINRVPVTGQDHFSFPANLLSGILYQFSAKDPS